MHTMQRLFCEKRGIWQENTAMQGSGRQIGAEAATTGGIGAAILFAAVSRPQVTFAPSVYGRGSVSGSCGPTRDASSAVTTSGVSSYNFGSSVAITGNFTPGRKGSTSAPASNYPSLVSDFLVGGRKMAVLQ